MKRLHVWRLGTLIAVSLLVVGSVIAAALSLAFERNARRSAITLAETGLSVQAHQASHFVDEILAARIMAATTLAATKELRDAATSSSASLAELEAAEREGLIAEWDAAWRSAASPDDPFVSQFLENDTAEALLDQIAAHPGLYGEVFLTNRFGALIASTGKLTTFAHGHKNWWQQSYADGRGARFLDDRGYDASVGDYVLGVVVPVVQDGQIQGILKCNFLILSAIGDTLGRLTEDEDSEILVARSNGLIVSGAGVEPLQESIHEDTTAAIAAAMGRNLRVRTEEEELLVAFEEISYTSSSPDALFGGTAETIDQRFGNSGESWVVIAAQPLSQILAPTNAAVNRVNLVTHGVIGVMILAAFLIGWRISKPVSRLAADVGAFGPEQLSIRVPIRGSFEVRKLAKAFNEVASELEDSVVSRDALAEEVARRELVEGILRESESKFRGLFEHMVSGFALHEIVLDAQGKPIDYVFMDVNATFEQMMGLGRDSIIGKKVTELIPGIEDDPTDWIRTYGDVALSGTSISFEQHAEPLGKWFSVAAYSPREGQFATIFIDITARKNMEEERAGLEVHLRQSQRMESIGTLASGVAHEINNPLMGILNYTELVKDRATDPKSQGFLVEIEHEGKRIAEIVKSLMQFSRPPGAEHRSADLNDIISRSLSLVAATLRRDQIAIKRDLPASLPRIRCFDQQIQQVLINLLTNAQGALNERYAEFDEDKIIRLTGCVLEKDQKDWVRITIEDHGAGISPEVIDRIFDPFFSTKERYQATGLGLSVSFGIVRDHGGELSVESKLGEYTRFHIDLPPDASEDV